jgi:hypothetical protein
MSPLDFAGIAIAYFIARWILRNFLKSRAAGDRDKSTYKDALRYIGYSIIGAALGLAIAAAVLIEVDVADVAYRAIAVVGLSVIGALGGIGIAYRFPSSIQ